MTPYRTPANRPQQSDVRTRAAAVCPDLDLVPVLVPFWLVTLARLVVGLARHETFGLDATLAMAAAILVPVILKDAALWCVHRMTSRAK